MTDLLVAMVAMFGAGVAAFVSPCVAPLVPGYLAVLADGGRARSEGADGNGGTDLRALWRVLAFAVAVAMTFALLGSVVSAAGDVFLTGRAAQVVAGVALVLLALWPMAAARRWWRLPAPPAALGDGRPATWRAAAMGVACGAAWTPCVGALLGAALTAAGGSGSTARGALLLFAFGLGVSLPLLALVILPAPRLPAPVRRVGQWVSAITPAVLAGVGLLLVVGWYDRLVALL
ncbi:MAG: cytochrome c biogenesis protein CcdA [Ilumatobacteraceae bacterium]|nr:sulfite exporter TauE/SafE family protein [Ilumatobacter sp.]